MLHTQRLQPITDWIPITADEIKRRNWEYIDIILVSGDAYVDHPSFGTAVIARVLEREGFRVAVIPQPNWRDDLRDFKKLGKPRLFFGVTAGNMDSMVNHYTAAKRLRSDDAFTPGNSAGFRPDYAVNVYSNILKQIYPEVPVVIGGIEASLRRFTHYDYWSDKLQPPILISSKADFLVYGMGERPVVELAKMIAAGASAGQIKAIPQIGFVEEANAIGVIDETHILLHSHKSCLESKKRFAENFVVIEKASNIIHPSAIVQTVDDNMVVINPPYPLMKTEDLDAIYHLPYTRLPHPKYKKRGQIPAYAMIRNSVAIHRGCFGGCSFCAISMHQGRFITSRTKKSVVEEVKNMVDDDHFDGVITDLGGPSANMYMMQGINLNVCEKCKRPSCIHPDICKNLNFDHKPLTELYKTVADIRGVKRVFIGSGIRYDMIVGIDKGLMKKYATIGYLQTVVKHHVSGRLKVAPEHADPEVLNLIRKPSFEIYRTFRNEFYNLSQKAGKKQELIPYLISSLPGSTDEKMAELAAALADMGYKPQQIQDFTPTPMNLATVSYYCGFDPYTGKALHIPKTIQQKTEQKNFLLWYQKEHKTWLRKKLLAMHRKDLMHKLLR